MGSVKKCESYSICYDEFCMTHSEPEIVNAMSKWDPNNTCKIDVNAGDHERELFSDYAAALKKLSLPGERRFFHNEEFYGIGFNLNRWMEMMAKRRC